MIGLHSDKKNVWKLHWNTVYSRHEARNVIRLFERECAFFLRICDTYLVSCISYPPYLLSCHLLAHNLLHNIDCSTVCTPQLQTNVPHKDDEGGQNWIGIWTFSWCWLYILSSTAWSWRDFKSQFSFIFASFVQEQFKWHFKLQNQLIY